jgi:hypothetical protein
MPRFPPEGVGFLFSFLWLFAARAKLHAGHGRHGKLSPDEVVNEYVALAGKVPSSASDGNCLSG